MQDAVIENVERVIEKRFGFACADWQRRRIAQMLPSMGLPRTGMDLSPDQLRRLVEKLTVGESYFFREPAQMNALLDVALPECRRSRDPDRPIRILSAGCASGEEAYSVAIALAEYAPDLAPRAHIHGIDINPVAIRNACSGRYSPWALRATPEHLRKRWFHQTGEHYQLRDEIRTAVTFEEKNLLEESANDRALDAFDVIFCRNVLIYFSDRSIGSVIARFARALAPGAFLFLGHSEILKGLSNHFDTLHASGAFYHRRTPSNQPPAEPPPSDPSRSWHEDIRHSSRRIADLTCRPGPLERPAVSNPACAQAPVSVERVFELFEAERFEEARVCLDRMAPGAARDPYLDFLTAVILINEGRLADAERLSSRLLGTAGLEATAHYLLGLCREQEGRMEGAQVRFAEAIRMDSSFAMPCLRMGLFAHRAGDPVSAREHLRKALDRFPRERPDRIRLLGGGFRREALVELCRTQLRTLGSKP